MMLSRVAERVYWMGRYIERAESTARLVNAFTTQVLDLPKGVEPGWKQLIDIMGTNSAFEKHYNHYDERNTVKFLLADTDDAGSIMTALAMARENVRTTRDLLPTEAWEHTNALYLYARENVQHGITRKGRFTFLKNIILRCQQITGLLSGTMSHDEAYDFVRTGRNLERADMTTRIVDSAVFILMPRKDEPSAYDNILWVNVLKSLSAFQMYRQHVRNRVVGDAVIRYLIRDSAFPRSVAYTVAEAQVAVSTLPRSKAPLRAIGRLQRRLNEVQTHKMSLDELHAFIDELQAGFNEVHEQIWSTWFRLDQVPVVAVARQAQTTLQTE
jgi:uncharacterized alpha-E superfamily protein